MNPIELMKIFDFILENMDELFANENVFNQEVLKTIRKIAKKKSLNEFELTDEQRGLLIDTFIQNDGTFDEDTPQIILDNTRCIEVALKNNFESVKYIKNISDEAKEFIIEQILKRKYVLTSDSPIFLKTSLQVALNSIKCDVQSADYIDWYSFKPIEQDELIDRIIMYGYEMSDLSHSFIKQNSKIVLAALRKGLITLDNMNPSLMDDPLIFKELVLNSDYLKSDPNVFKRLKLFSDPEVFSVALKCLKRHRTDNQLYIERFNKMYNDAINSKPLLEDFHLIFDYVAEEQWKKHKKKFAGDYNNIFGKICSLLRENKPLQEIYNNLSFLETIKSILGKKYSLLEDAMAEYYRVYHNKSDDRQENLEKAQNLISDLSALYIAKSKETYKQEEIKKCYESIRKFYKLNIHNQHVHQLVSGAYKKQKFRELYKKNDAHTYQFIDILTQKYSANLDLDVINMLIREFVLEGKSKLEEIILPPMHYDSYIKYKKVLKLIKRLNIGNIYYEGIEVENHRNLIVFDEKMQEYKYVGKTFTDDEIDEYTKYEQYLELFEKLKHQIMYEIQKIEFDGNLDKNLSKVLSDTLPFTDEYFIFNSELLLESFSLNKLIQCTMRNKLDFELSSFTNDEAYHNIYNLLVNKAIIVLLLTIDPYRNDIFIDNGINKEIIFEIINNMNFMIELAKETNFKMRDLSDYLFIYNMILYGGKDSIALIGQENIEKVSKSQIHSDTDLEETIKMAKELVCKMSMRSKSTVPYVFGQSVNYKYSLYDSQDASILTCGIDTDACFEIGNKDNDFLHYCALDKNGFVIKITDINGNFIARASGFRNGNSIYLNQLRTIYDNTRLGYCGKYESEKQELIETLKMACENIIEVSQENTQEEIKIDYVFITASYIFKNYEPVVPSEVKSKIGEDPMDNESADWISFCKNTQNLDEAPIDGRFATDYRIYDIICLASSHNRHLKNQFDIVKKDVPALYKRIRNKIFVTDNIDSSVYRRINRIRAVETYLNDATLTQLEIPKESVVMIGDNWYLVYKDGEVLSSCVLDFDEEAKLEFESALRGLSVTINNQSQRHKALKK